MTSYDARISNVLVSRYGSLNYRAIPFTPDNWKRHKLKLVEKKYGCISKNIRIYPCKPLNAGALAGSVLSSLNYLSRKTTSRRQKTKEKEKYANLLLIYSENQQALGGLANVARKWHIFLHTFLVLRLSHLTIWQETMFWITSTEGSGLSSKLSKITKMIVVSQYLTEWKSE